MQGLDGQIKAAFKKGNAYFIPPYQRGYAWDATRWQGLIQDVMEVATRTAAAPAHWLGVILLSDASIPNNPLNEEEATPYTVIDGQQRLVTLRVWMAALADYSAENAPNAGVSAKGLSQISVQKADRKSFEVAISNGWRDPAHHPLIGDGALAAYFYFRWLLWLGDEALLSPEPVPMAKLPAATPTGVTGWEDYWATEAATAGMAKKLTGARINRHPLKISPADLMTATRDGLRIFSIIHESSTDEEQAVIFDTLNGMRTELEPLDHVRNSLFVRLDHQTASALYDGHWESAESRLRALGTKRMRPERIFLYDYLISRGERKHQGSINASRTAVQFKAMVERDAGARADLETFLKDDVILAMSAWPCVIGKSRSFHHDSVTTTVSDRAWNLIRSIRTLTENPANPLVLFYLMEHKRRTSGIASTGELEARLFTIEAFLARQLLAGRPFSPLRAYFMEVMANVYPDPSESALEKALKNDWPTDSQARSFMKSAPFYSHAKPAQIGAIMRGIERHVSGPACVDIWIGNGPAQYTIEHIYPQRPHAAWGTDFASWGASQAKMNGRVHRLGNLTIATKPFNSASGNKRLADKQADYKTLKNAPVGVHRGWLTAGTWDDAAIEARGDDLVDQALLYWPVP